MIENDKWHDVTLSSLIQNINTFKSALRGHLWYKDNGIFQDR